jgi:hypothetical protein
MRRKSGFFPGLKECSTIGVAEKEEQGESLQSLHHLLLSSSFTEFQSVGADGGDRLRNS